MTEQETKQRRPFHETVVVAIDQASSRDEMECLTNLIKATKIPKGHEEIIAAWNQRRKEMGKMGWGNEDLGVPADLLEQKQEVEKKKEEKKTKEQSENLPATR